MDISVIDPRLAVCEIKETDVVWHNPRVAPFSLRGVFYDEEKGFYYRMPKEVSINVSEGVHGLSKCTAGGRLRFRTDSPYIAVRCLAPTIKPMPHMPLTGSHGFCYYLDGFCHGKMTPTIQEAVNPDSSRISFAGSTRHTAAPGMHDVELYFPLYGGVAEFEVGLAEGSKIEAPRPYTYEKPIVLYGSSIAQGACASRPGNDVLSHLCRMFDADVLNLGFSGCGNCEPAMIDYLGTLDASAIIFDYNYYVDRKDRVLPPHYDVYRKLRDAHPDIPIIMIDKPGCDYDAAGYAARTEMIRGTYERATAEGDKKVAMIDAYDLFGDDFRDACLVDRCHPTDLGFLRMALAIEKVLRPLL